MLNGRLHVPLSTRDLSLSGGAGDLPGLREESCPRQGLSMLAAVRQMKRIQNQCNAVKSYHQHQHPGTEVDRPDGLRSQRQATPTLRYSMQNSTTWFLLPMLQLLLEVPDKYTFIIAARDKPVPIRHEGRRACEARMVEGCSQFRVAYCALVLITTDGENEWVMWAADQILEIFGWKPMKESSLWNIPSENDPLFTDGRRQDRVRAQKCDGVDRSPFHPITQLPQKRPGRGIPNLKANEPLSY